MARRRGNPNPQANLDSLGVGGLAGELQHGERGIVEAVAAPPQQQGAPGPAPVPPQGGGSPIPDVDLWGPTAQPDVPINAGMGAQVLEDDVDHFLRALNEIAPHDDIRRLLEWRDF